MSEPSADENRMHVPGFDKKLMTCRVFWLDTDGGEPGDGAWYWVETDETGMDFGESVGPFESAIDAGKSARAAVLKRSSGDRT